ncbi:tetratricopeptide repeat protein [Paenibacillus lemnae]|nr:tetratricopeptide repeat protein [Paenibacillus lemnae]
MDRIWLWMGKQYRKKQDLEKALQYMEKGRSAIQALDDQMGYIELLHHTGRSEEALLFLGEVIDQRGAARAYERRAHILRELNRDEEAIADLNEAIGLNRDYYMNWYTRGVTYKDLGDYEKAAADLKECIKREAPETVISTYYELGMTYYESGNPAAAIEWFRKSLQDADRSIPMYYFMLARCLNLTGEASEAEEVLLQGTALADKYEAEPDQGYTLFDQATNYSRGAFMTFQRQMKETYSFRLLLADLYLQLGRHEDGIAALTQGLEKYPGAVDLYLKRAQLQADWGKSDEAREDLELALHQDPDELRAYAELVRLLREGGEEEQVLALLSKLYHRQPETPIVCYWMADSLYRLGRYEEAMVMNDRLLKLENDDPANYIQRADIGIERRELSSAVEALDEALKLEDAPEFHNKRSYVFYLQGRNEEALLELQKTIELDPEYEQHPAYLSASGHIYKEMGMWDLAIQSYSRAIRATPGHVKLYEFRAGCFLETGQLEQAASDCTHGLELDPAAAELYSLRSSVYYAMKDYSRAKHDVLEYLHVYPAHAGAYYRLGQIHFKNNEEDQALEAFNQVLDIIPEHAESYLYKAHIYFGQLEHEQTVQHIVNWSLFYEKEMPVGDKIKGIQSLDGFTEDILDEAAERLSSMYGQNMYLS